MGALRKAGVWLGLVEDEDETGATTTVGTTKGGYRESRYRPEPIRATSSPTRTRTTPRSRRLDGSRSGDRAG